MRPSMESEKIIDPTCVELTPSNMLKCLGNGEHLDEEGNPIECCCDECDYLILCLGNENKKQYEDTSKMINK